MTSRSTRIPTVALDDGYRQAPSTNSLLLLQENATLRRNQHSQAADFKWVFGLMRAIPVPPPPRIQKGISRKTDPLLRFCPLPSTAPCLSARQSFDGLEALPRHGPAHMVLHTSDCTPATAHLVLYTRPPSSKVCSPVVVKRSPIVVDGLATTPQIVHPACICCSRQHDRDEPDTMHQGAR